MAGSQNSDKALNTHVFRKKLLAWYDRHQRPMPWRKRAGEPSNPYHTWLSEIMLQQTTVTAVVPYFLKFLDHYPTIHDLAKAPKDNVMRDWAGLGYYARARNLHACAQIVSQELDGVFPDTQEELKKLPGIGDYSSNSIAAIAFNKPANVVDGNVERVMARLFQVEEPLPKSKKLLKELAGNIAWEETKRAGDYAQAIMELGATICTPTAPKCTSCPVQKFCKAYKNGVQADLPQKEKKKAKPQKFGAVYWITNEKEQIMLHRRPETEMLGGMLALPDTGWMEKKAYQKPDNTLKIQVKHSFTHFDLTLDIVAIQHEKGMKLPEKRPIWVPYLELSKAGLPSLYQKVVKLMK